MTEKEESTFLLLPLLPVQTTNLKKMPLEQLDLNAHFQYPL